MNALPGHIQAVYVQNILKVLTVLLTKSSHEHAIEVFCFLHDFLFL